MKTCAENFWYDGLVHSSQPMASLEEAGASSVGKLVLLDRDGVINRDLPTGVLSADQLEVFQQALDALRHLRNFGVTVVVITNQACVGRGELSIQELSSIHEKMVSEVELTGGSIDAIFTCVHRADESCECRKPKPGLLAQAQARYGFSPSEVWFVGDDLRDVQAAEAFGCRPALVRTGKGEKAAAMRPDVPVFADLDDFVQACFSARA